MSDDINHPSHYTSNPSGIECIEVVEHMTFNRGNAIKYLWRAGLKDHPDGLKDLDKAIWYCQREKQRLMKLHVKEDIAEEHRAVACPAAYGVGEATRIDAGRPPPGGGGPLVGSMPRYR